MSATAQRYTAVAIVLHWAIAFAVVFMIPLGFWMHEQAEHGDAATGLFRAYQLHKSIGLTVLALSLVRLGWRLTNPPPPLPAHMPRWETLRRQGHALGLLRAHHRPAAVGLALRLGRLVDP